MSYKNKYRNIPWTIDISGKRTIRTIDQREVPFNTKKFMQIIWLCILTVILLLMINKTEANDPKYKTDICDTNKCKARVERLNECDWDIKCAVKLTQEASYEHLVKDITNLEKESSKEVKQGLKQAVEFTANFEWLRLKAYFDWYANNSNRWSICYGTKSYKWETATKEECKKRKMAVITPIYNSIPNCFNDSQKTALTSYMYNTWGFQMNLKYHISECRKKDVEYIMNVYGWNKELIPRRKAELVKYHRN